MAVSRQGGSLPLRLRCRLWWLARTLPVFVRRRSLLELLRQATPAAPDPRWRPEAAAAVVPVLAAVSRPWRMRGRRCLREGLLAYRFLRLAGHPATIHFGVLAGGAPGERTRAHCWVSVADEVLVNPPGAEGGDRRMVELFRFDGAAWGARGERLDGLPALAFAD